MRREGEHYHYDLDARITIPVQAGSFDHTFDLRFHLLYLGTEGRVDIACGTYSKYSKLPLSQSQTIEEGALNDYVDDLYERMNELIEDTPPGINLPNAVDHPSDLISER